jgi:cation diffusion facilitator family transporter
MADKTVDAGGGTAEKTALMRRARIIRTASVVALLGNTLLASLKIGTGIRAGSLAVLGDGIDSSVDVLVAVMTLVAARIMSRPADRGHPWGHGRAETVATALLSCILFFAGAQLILSSASDLVFGKGREVPSPPALVITLVSIAGKLTLAWSQAFFGKKADSPVLRANAKNMAGDVILSGGVLAGVGLSLLLGIGAIDSAFAVLAGLWVIKSAVGIFIEANMELMDGGSSPEFYRLLFDAVHRVAGAGNPHRARMRRIAGLWDIDLDIEVDPSLTVREAHRIATGVERAIKEQVGEVYDIMVHVEPSGEQGHGKEGYGLSEREIRACSKTPLGSEQPRLKVHDRRHGDIGRYFDEGKIIEKPAGPGADEAVQGVVVRRRTLKQEDRRPVPPFGVEGEADEMSFPALPLKGPGEAAPGSPESVGKHHAFRRKPD